eukprot:c16354_g1_i2.p1 GENE.c16354_g1_i2~~c16354_g1_i2.p1  ORF type:complete len:119 (+),score=7.23 c16354_g1_i2:35-358(+)
MSGQEGSQDPPNEQPLRPYSVSTRKSVKRPSSAPADQSPHIRSRGEGLTSCNQKEGHSEMTLDAVCVPRQCLKTDSKLKHLAASTEETRAGPKDFNVDDTWQTRAES